MKLALKISDTAAGEPCGICGTWVEPLGSGLVATLADNWQLICSQCTALNQPQLLLVLDLVEASEGVVGLLKGDSGVYGWINEAEQARPLG